MSTITFVGVDPAIEQEVRGQISLDPGDEFDFLVLQRDIDRLRERFYEQGFFEARIRTRRVAEELETNTVALEYRVDRGPRTVLEIVGAVLPSSVTEELEQAWGTQRLRPVPDRRPDPARAPLPGVDQRTGQRGGRHG